MNCQSICSIGFGTYHIIIQSFPGKPTLFLPVFLQYSSELVTAPGTAYLLHSQQIYSYDLTGNSNVFIHGFLAYVFCCSNFRYRHRLICNI